MDQNVYQLSFPTVPAAIEPPRPKAPVLSRTHGRAKRDAAMQRADTNANDMWKDIALSIVKLVAETHKRFTTDAVIELLAKTNATTHEPRALGPIMQKARRMGWITGTTEFVKSAAVSRHCAPKQVWVSNLYP